MTRAAAAITTALLVAHVALTLAWAAVVYVWADRPAFIMAGTLVATPFVAGLLLALQILDRHRVTKIAKAAVVVIDGGTSSSSNSNSNSVLEAVRALRVAILVASALALVTHALYALALGGAALRATAPTACPAPAATSDAVTLLSCDMWVREPALAILAFALLGAEFVLALVTVGWSAHRLYTEDARLRRHEPL